MQKNICATFLLTAFCVTYFVVPIFADTSASSGSSCSSSERAKARKCVKRAKSKYPFGPCQDHDWKCTCNFQKDLWDCVEDCPSISPWNITSYIQSNCAGQHDGIWIDVDDLDEKPVMTSQTIVNTTSPLTLAEQSKLIGSTVHGSPPGPDDEDPDELDGAAHRLLELNTALMIFFAAVGLTLAYF